VPWRELSGDGIALASGYRAADVVLDAEGASTAQPAATPLVQERP
jgi:hypothetical protein